MKLTTKGRYAVTAMLDLALHAEDEVVTVADISRRQQISVAYLEQLFGRLRKQGLVESVRGPGGGYRLGHPAEKISVLSVIDLFEPEDDMRICGRTDATACRNCAFAPACAEAYRAMRDELAAISVADILIDHTHAHASETA